MADAAKRKPSKHGSARKRLLPRRSTTYANCGGAAPQTQRAYNARMTGISASDYPNNEKNARMRDVSPAYNFDGSQYRNILGISDSAFSGGDSFVAYADYLNELSTEKEKEETKNVTNSVGMVKLLPAWADYFTFLMPKDDTAASSNQLNEQDWTLKMELTVNDTNSAPMQQTGQVVNNSNSMTAKQNFDNYLRNTKPKTKEEVAELIRDNAQYIKDAAEAYGVDPKIVAGVIYAEQVKNVNYADMAGDWVGYYGLLDTSIGLGQVKISTAKFIEDMGYIPKTSATEGGWDLPIMGPVYGTQTMAREMRLENNQVNTMYVAAYLKYFQDTWEEKNPEIASDPVILGHSITWDIIKNHTHHPNLSHLALLLGITMATWVSCWG